MEIIKLKNFKKPIIPIKQKHSPTGHTYNRICSRSCYLINNLNQWTYCECIKKARHQQKMKNKKIKLSETQII